MLFAFNQSLWIVRICGQRGPAEADLRRAREEVGTGGVVVDSSTARHVFDYHLPAGATMLDYVVPFNRAEGKLRWEEKTAAVPWIVTRPFLVLYVKGTPLMIGDYPRVQIGTHGFNSVPLQPDQPLIAP